MPPLIHVAVGWLVGVFLGSVQSLATVPLPLTAVAGAVVGACSALVAACEYTSPRKRAFVGAIAAIGAAGVLSARATVSHDGVCRAAIASAISRGAPVLVVFDDRVAPRLSARGMATADGRLARCDTPILARIATGAAPAGHWRQFRGTALITSRGLRLEGNLMAATSPRRDWRRTLRGRTGEIIDRDFGRNAPLVRALLIADQDGIAPNVRDTFADAGLVHMLSISGLHVAIIAGALLTVLSAMRISRTISYAVAMTVITGYVVVLGAPPPAVRSAVMLAVVGLSERLQRPTHPWTALALGAVIPTMQPTVVLDLGWQLSVSGMAALVAARTLLRRWRLVDGRGRRGWSRRLLVAYRRLDGWRYTLMRELVTGTVATVVTAPLIAWTFGRVSMVAPLSNLVAGPIVAFVQPALFLALLASPWPTLSRLVADATAPPLALLDAVARRCAEVPFASLHLSPTAITAVCAGVAAAAFVRATASRRWVPGLTVAGVALSIAAWWPAFTRGNGQLELHVLDVGQGDALALRTPRGRWVLVDAGRRWDGGDAGRRTIVPYVRRLGGDVAAFVMTHAHDDHVGGASSVVAALSPRRWWEPAFVTTSGAYRNALLTFSKSGGAWRRVHPGDRWRLDGVEVTVLAPDSAWTAVQQDANETSVVLRVRFGVVAFLLTGDAEAAEEQWLLGHNDPGDLQADVLKLGHHGSKTSSTQAFVDAVQPRLGVISVGAGNRYGHPSPETLQTFTDRGIPLLRTDREGSFVVATNGRDLAVRIGRDTWPLNRRP
ncbi:MAG: DNA internalization-related competence protein ComEC/Rec2 [Gemmatimonadaceae bacterium]|nr:DNA internalization-related competence protein ComEC/Rec2 [Gemmatimonadaceae bacterium]